MMRTERYFRRLAVAATGALLVGLLSLTPTGCSRPEPQRSPMQELQMKTLLIPIEGMSCVSCAARVTKELKSLKGVAQAEVNLADRNARVQFAPAEIPESQIAAAINGLGYSAGKATEAK